MMNYKNLRWLLPVLSGLFLVLSSPPFNVPFLLFFSFLPLFFFLNYKCKSLKESFFGGLITGFIFFGQVLFWVFEISPSNFTDIRNGALNFFLVFLTWFTSASFLALFTGFFSLSYQFLKRKNLWDVLLVPSLWIVFDCLRVWAYGIFMSGTESFSGSHWTIGNLAYSLAQNQSFRLLAGVGGIYLISFLIVLVNVLLFHFLRRLILGKERGRIWYRGGVLIILPLIVASYFIAPPIGENGKEKVMGVAIVQTKIPSSFFPEELMEMKNQIQRQLLENIAQDFAEVDIVVLPEGSNFLEQKGNKEYLANLFVERNVWIIDSGNKERKFVGFLYNVKEGTSARYEKRLLIPYGDYLPYFFEFIGRAVNKEWLENIEKLKETKRGDDLPVLTISRESKISLLFCSEAVSPGLHLDSVEKGSQTFLNAGSLAFSGGSKILDSQTLAVLQLRAAENGKYLVRSTNYGKSYIIDDKGKVVKITPNFEDQVIFGEVQLISQKTLYTKYGDWILILGGLLSLTFFLTCVILRQRGEVET